MALTPSTNKTILNIPIFVIVTKVRLSLVRYLIPYYM